jgi:hypothetical protein
MDMVYMCLDTIESLAEDYLSVRRLNATLMATMMKSAL